MRKCVFSVSDQVGLQPACPATETSRRLEIWGIQTEDPNILKTCPCNEDPLTPHFYIVNEAFERVPTIYALCKNKKNITIFHLKIIIFTAVKKSLNIAWACFRNGRNNKGTDQSMWMHRLIYASVVCSFHSSQHNLSCLQWTLWQQVQCLHIQNAGFLMTWLITINPLGF